MAYLKGALIEYGIDLIGPIPNIVIFQFNPETVSRTIKSPNNRGSSAGKESTESNQVGELPIEMVSFTAHFTAADQLNENNPLARMYGIGPQLAALEKMVFPKDKVAGSDSAGTDAIGDSLSGGRCEDRPEIPIARQKYPRILFIWGLTRILPVIIDSISITEKFYDALLNPIQAEVSMSLAVPPIDIDSDDTIGKGAFAYTSMKKTELAMYNLEQPVHKIIDIIPF